MDIVPRVQINGAGEGGSGTVQGMLAMLLSDRMGAVIDDDAPAAAAPDAAAPTAPAPRQPRRGRAQEGNGAVGA